MGPWRASKNILTGHPRDSERGPQVKFLDACFASDRVTGISTALTSRHAASVRRSPAERSQGVVANSAGSATARSKASDPNSGSRADEFACAPAQQFDGVARSLPATSAVWVRRLAPRRPGLLRTERTPPRVQPLGPRCMSAVEFLRTTATRPARRFEAERLGVDRLLQRIAVALNRRLRTEKGN
jgi:hypothetical protein